MTDTPRTPEPDDDARRCAECGAAIPGDAPGGGCPACLVEAALDPEPPAGVPSRESLAAIFPELEIRSLLGRGGMGAVFKAYQTKLDRIVALKLLPAQEGERGAAFAERFAREARAMARLDHPNIVRVFEFGERRGLYFLVMEHVDGVNLREAMQDGDITPRQALAIVPQICDALQYAHDQGVVHRDIKPENVLLSKDGAVKVVDFGLAKLLVGATEDATLTRAGQVMGTVHYMAPEQIESPASVDHRADIYSLGVVFYEMLTGELPVGRFEPPSHRARVDARLDEVVLRALERRRERRYQKVSEVKTAVSGIDDPGTGAPVAAAAPVTEGRRRRTGTPGLLSLLALPGGVLAAVLSGLAARELGADVLGQYVAVASALGVFGLLAILLGSAAVVESRRDALGIDWRGVVGLTAALIWTPSLAAASYQLLDVRSHPRLSSEQRYWAELEAEGRMRRPSAVPASQQRVVRVFNADGTEIAGGADAANVAQMQLVFRRWVATPFSEEQARTFLHPADVTGTMRTEEAGLPFCVALAGDPRRASFRITEVRYTDAAQSRAIVTAESDEGRALFPMKGMPDRWYFAAGRADVEWFASGDR